MSHREDLLAIWLRAANLVPQLQLQVPGGGIGFDDRGIQSRVKENPLERGEAENRRQNSWPNLTRRGGMERRLLFKRGEIGGGIGRQAIQYSESSGRFSSKAALR